MFEWAWQYTWFTPVLLVASLVLGALTTYAWQNRDAPGASAFAVLMAAASLWAFAYGIQLAGANEPTKRFWANVVHIGVTVVPVAWFCFTVQFTGRDHWLTRRTIAGIALIPTTYVILVWTNEYHYLVREPLGVESVPIAGGSMFIYRQTFGPIFYAHAGYGYALMTAGVVLLVQLLFWSPRLYRRQVGLLLFGGLAATTTNTIHHAGFSPVANFDLTPFSFPLIGIAYFIAIYQYRLLDLTPVAREFVVDNLGEGVIVLDRDDRVVDVNPSAERLLDRSADEAVGRDLGVLLPASTSLVSSTPEYEPVEEELVVQDGGTRRYLHCSSSPVYDVRDELIGRSIVVRDVTENRELEAEVEATLERLQQSNADLEAFTGAISHDLREPLRTTENYLSLLEKQMRDTGRESGNWAVGGSGQMLDDDRLELLTVARENAERMQQMVTDLLQYSQIGATEAAVESVDCNQVVADVTEALQFEIEDRAATITVGDLPTVTGVEHLLSRLFQNLLMNALKYSDEPPEIHIEGAQQDGGWEFTVRDNGIGIEPEQCERVFELFTRTNPETTSGTGMGLAISKKIVEAHGGAIVAESTPGEGTTIVFTIADRGAV